jgi:uncharacterized protein with NRDE domain
MTRIRASPDRQGLFWDKDGIIMHAAGIHNSFPLIGTFLMCLLILAHQLPDLPLVVAANRDEFHARATAASGFWPGQPQLLAGKDLEQGGTWMGITDSGRFAAITNYRDPARTVPAPRSRGELPLAYLQGKAPPESYLQELSRHADEYAGFNLLVGDLTSLWCYSNGTLPGENQPQCLAPGIYGLSNARLDTPWPKVTMGKQRLQALLDAGAVNHDGLAAVVSDRQLADPAGLHQQGMNPDMERLLSAQFIVTSSYGTRSTTSLWIDAQNLAHWRELSFDPQGQTSDIREREVRLHSSP